MLDLDLFMDMLRVDSTSGKERGFALLLADRLKTPSNRVQTFEVGDGTLNLLLTWGEPQVWFCTHLDTVPPYIPPSIDGDIVRGRGSCDAKGQIFSMFEACKVLEAQGETGFALLLLAGEETGSFGAKAWTRDCGGGDLVVVGEPTDTKMVTASKGTASFSVAITGKPCHSGYPHLGKSAVDIFVDMVCRLRRTAFPVDPVLGETVWNIGKLSSDNPQNILSPSLSFRIYFRTTGASAAAVNAVMESFRSEEISVTAHGGDAPMDYYTIPRAEKTVVSFGSDAPQLGRFARRALVGPGSITVAHTADEYVRISEIEKAVSLYVEIFRSKSL